MTITIDTTNKTVTSVDGTMEELVTILKKNYPKEWKSFKIVASQQWITYPTINTPYTYTDFSTSQTAN